MKKFTLLLMAALMTTGAMASSSLLKKVRGKSPIAKELKNATPGAFRSLNAKMQAGKTFYAGMPQNAAAELKAIARAPEEEDPTMGLDPYISTYTYMYDEYYGGFLMCNMFSAFAKISDGKVLFSLFGLEPVEGVIESGDNWMSTQIEERIDSITFNTDKIIAHGEESGKDFVMGFSDFSFDEEDNLVMTRSTSKTLGAYYSAEDNVLIFNGDIVVGIYELDPTVNDPVLAVSYLELIPYSTIAPQLLKGTYTAKDHQFKTETGETTAYIEPWANEAGELRYDFYISGFAYDPSAWLCLSQSNDGLTAGLDPFQYIVTSGFWIDETKTDSFEATIINLGLTETDDGLDYSYADTDNMGMMFFFVTEDENSITLESDGDSFYADYGIADPDHRNQTGTYWLLYDLNLTITNERAISDEELAVKSVGSDKVASAEYFDMQGRRVSANHKGVTLMKTRMADGSVISRKLVRK